MQQQSNGCLFIRIFWHSAASDHLNLSRYSWAQAKACAPCDLLSKTLAAEKQNSGRNGGPSILGRLKDGYPQANSTENRTQSGP